MPRIFDSANNAVDFCRAHFPKTEDSAYKRFGNRGTGPDGRGDCFSYDCDHPSYEDDDYQCHTCEALLTDDDY